ncbi:MAG: SGNH/GDSL hydrolase family protein [Prevotella sp.]|nr:SGNH/GDSL hydrolase family protein [Prevotella sp.]
MPDNRGLLNIWHRFMTSEVKILLIFIIVMGVGIGFSAEPFLSFSEAGSLPADSIDQPLPSANVEEQQKRLDESPQRFLFFGDSMLEGLMRRFGDYAAENGHEVNVVLWYSSSTERWATTRVLEQYMQKYRPTYVVICLGSNELFVRDLPKREQYVADIVGRLDSVPFVWISPPNWRKDTGINDIIIKHVGQSRFFDSRRLTLERGSDHMHPTMRAGAQWMDSVAVWMSSKLTAHPVRMNFPKVKKQPKSIKLLPPEYDGKEGRGDK